MWKKPNWRNDIEYDFTENLSLNDWAWQFLRRNPTYKVDWEKTLSKFENHIPISTHDEVFYVFPDGRKKYGFSQNVIIDPSTDYPSFYGDQLFFSQSYDPIKTNDLLHDLKIDKNQRVLVVDYTKSISSQLNHYKRELINEQEELIKTDDITIKIPKNDWKKYLRILDAYEDNNIEHRRIANVFYPRISNDSPDYHASSMVRDDYKASKSLSFDYGYKKIIQLSDCFSDN